MVGEESPSLDEVATLLVQLEPEDAAGARRAAQILAIVLARPVWLPLARERLEELARLLGELAEGRATDAPGVLERAGRLLEAARDAQEAAESAAKPTDAEAVTRPQGPVTTGPSGLPPEADPELTAEFVVESLDYIDGAETALLALENNPDDAEAINTVFRAFHTIKGTSAYLGLQTLTELAHGAESLLSRIRDGEVRFAGGYADLALRSTDMLKGLLHGVRAVLRGQPLTTPPGYDELLRRLANPEAAGISEESPARSQVSQELGDEEVAPVWDAVASSKDEGAGPAPGRWNGAPRSDMARGARAEHHGPAAEPSAESWVRVRTDRLDRLIDMVGELVIAQSMVTQDPTVNDSAHHELGRKVGHAAKIVRELQDLSMALRMVPLKATFQKMARVVRDVARKAGKQVELVVEGEDTEIDRRMVDVIADPLVHMVRNGVDHGIEPPDVRRQRGKPPVGRLRLAAYHAGGNVVVEVQDDGRGLDREAIVRKAIARGLIESDKGLSDSDVYNLIFAPGFSTAEKVTDVSGRGMGMDVVRRNVEAVRGHIEIVSEPGQGCLFILRLPLTLAITDGILVRVGPERYIVPTTSIALSFRPSREALFTVAERGEMVLWRGETLPVYRLHRLFGIAGAVEDPTQGLLVVVGEGRQRCALLVDELLGQQQAVAKSLGDGLGKVPGITGGAILGDGRVGLILDPSELIALAQDSDSSVAFCQSPGRV